MGCLLHLLLNSLGFSSTVPTVGFRVFVGFSPQFGQVPITVSTVILQNHSNYTQYRYLRRPITNVTTCSLTLDI